MVTATFRFYEEQNDFLQPALPHRGFERACAHAATLKRMMEALGVLHTADELILINGESSGFDQILREGDRVAVYPIFEAFDVTPQLLLRDHPLRVTRFVADAHLGGLAHLLRTTGFDTLFDPSSTTARSRPSPPAITASYSRAIANCSSAARSRAAALCTRASQRLQLCEVFELRDLARSARPFTLCVHCNAPLLRVHKSLTQQRVPALVFDCYERLSNCEVCGRIFWEDRHRQRMLAVLDGLVAS